jgi:replicative DNA helicase
MGTNYGQDMALVRATGETPLTMARRLMEAGLCVLPLHRRAKAPKDKGWPERRLRAEALPEAFADATGIGVLTGLPENPLADVDLDCPEARAVAPFLLLEPAARHGRPGSRGSHWWYWLGESVKTRQFRDPVRIARGEKDTAMICELRGKGAQTMVPPSIHPSGETLAWEAGSLEQKPVLRWKGKALETRLSRVAAGALLARYWSGTARHYSALALSGGLLRAGWTVPDVERFVRAVAVAAGDEEVEDRVRAVADTAAALQAHEPEVTGWPRLTELYGEVGPAVVTAVLDWLGLARPAEPEPWNTDGPRPFIDSHLPAFPTDALPDWVREMVEGVAEQTQTPTDVAAMLALASLALGIQRKVRVRVRPGWEESTSLWTVSAQESGSRKSAVFSAMIAPIRAHECDEAERAAPELEQIQQQRRIAEGRRAECERHATKATSAKDREKWEQEARQAAAEYAALPEPASPRLLCQDVTEEALGKLLSAHGGRMGNFDAEGGLFRLMAGRYSDKNEAAFQLYLKGWSGEDHILDRASRAGLTVRQAALTLALTVQPQIIADLGRNPAFDLLGLLGRFVLAMSKGRVGWRDPDPPAVSEGVVKRYHDSLRLVLAISYEHDAEGRAVPVMLEFTEEARAQIVAFEAWREPQLRPSGRLGEIQRWASKLTGHLVRIAVLLHVAERINQGSDAWKQPISADTWGRARQFAEYLIPHALAAFHLMRVDGAFGQAEVILDWIRDKQRTRFSRRELFDQLRGARFPRVEALEPALALLVEYGYLRRLPDEVPGVIGGRPERNRYQVHPEVLRPGAPPGSRPATEARDV